MRQKRAVQQPQEPDMNSFATDFNKCLFKFWTTFCGPRESVLQMPVKCPGGTSKQLCYGANPNQAQFAVCYSTETKIPLFSGHVLDPNIPEGNQDSVAQDDDYRAAQNQIIDNYNQQQQHFFSRGHLTPNADFADADRRSYTMVTTNIAPQWQLFNAQNWAEMERLLRGFATQENHPLYVFTGTSGQAKNRAGEEIKLNQRVVVPLYYWKAVCDPLHLQSIFFYARNPTDTARADKQERGCEEGEQTQTSGIVMCKSIDDGIQAIEKDVPGAILKIPEFTRKKACKPNEMGALFTGYIRGHAHWN
ncbi:unnamed protein product [Porites lobata]|uniref:Uncharacterized protein n=1 Tax=Porites lobata TaxID=104759 RepID=A0ABN8QNT8_9CNID|nr:unnamed protein product [Porites lobata]